MKPIKILVVDDEPPIRKLLLIGLKGYGYQVTAVENGAGGAFPGGITHA